jgi:hypothetical protein
MRISIYSRIFLSALDAVFFSKEKGGMPYRDQPTHANKRGLCWNPMTRAHVSQKIRKIQEGKISLQDVQDEFKRKVLDKNSWCRKMPQIDEKTFHKMLENVPWYRDSRGSFKLSASPLDDVGLAKSPEKSPEKSHEKSPEKSPVKSPVKSPEKSPEKSPVKSPVKSPRKSSLKSYLNNFTTHFNAKRSQSLSPKSARQERIREAIHLGGGTRRRRRNQRMTQRRRTTK